MLDVETIKSLIDQEATLLIQVMSDTFTLQFHLHVGQ